MATTPLEHAPAGGSRGVVADERRSVEGMESVVATVSGYHGRERFNLIKLITTTGAHYVGAMGRSTTHLVCWELKGDKYNLAKKFKTKIVSHSWFENCLKKGKRIPEGPYIMQSGKQVGSLSWEMPEEDTCGKRKWKKLDEDNHRKRKCLSSREMRNVISGFSNTVDDARIPVSSSKHCGADVPCLCVGQEQPGCTFISRLASGHKKDLYDGFERSRSSEHKGPQLRRKDTIFEYFTWDVISSNQDNCLTEICDQRGSSNSGSSDNLISPQILEYSDVNNAESRNTTTEEFEAVVSLSNTHASEITSSDEAAQNWHNASGANENEEGKQTNALPLMTASVTSPDLSCVICWTEFSSTRGILACGHRFCYTCIEEWANCMASKGKVSTCPLCKATFTSITKVEAAASSDQKIYSQTITCSMSADLCVLPIHQAHDIGSQAMESVCHQCCNREPEDLLLCCHLCRNQWVHACCLDPPIVPWTCVHCRDLRVLYQLFR